MILLGIFCFQKAQAVDSKCCIYRGLAEATKNEHRCYLIGSAIPAVANTCPEGKEISLQCLEYFYAPLYKDWMCNTIWGNQGGKVFAEKEVICEENELCLERIFTKETMTWTGDKSVEIVLGEKRTFTITAISGVQPSDQVSIKCLNCDPEFVGISGGGGQIVLEFDSAKHLSKTGVAAYPRKVEFKLRGTTQATFDNFSLEFTIKQVDCSKYQPPCSENYNQCFPLEGKCVSRLDTSLCSQLTKYPQLCGTQEDGTNPGSKVCYWNKQINQCQTALGKGISEEYAAPEGYEERGGIIPPCAFSGQCRSVNDILETVIRVGKSFFAIIGSFAFVFFIYGGITMILSFGNAEKTKKGRDILVAAVIGLIIVFSAYLLIDFVLDAIGVEQSFRGI